MSDRGDPAAAPPSRPQHLSVTLMAVTRLPTVRLSPVMKLPRAQHGIMLGMGISQSECIHAFILVIFFVCLFFSENEIKIDPFYFF